MTNSVVFHQDASHDEARVTFGGSTTIIDLSGYGQKSRSHLVLRLSDWALRGCVGYPKIEE